MKIKLLTCTLALLAPFLFINNVSAAEKGSKAEPKASASKSGEPKAKRDTYPLYGKVVSITPRTLTIVRSDSPEAKESKYTINTDTEIVNGDKPATAEDVIVGRWVGGLLKKAGADGNDVVVKLNVAAKQKEAGSAKGGTKKGEGKGTAKKKAE